MNAVRASDLPEQSALHGLRGPGDFLDCYSVAAKMTPRRAAEIITDFPGWARFLLFLRWCVTAPFGLKNEVRAAVDKIGPFPVIAETGTEILAGFDDRHLNFAVSVLTEPGMVYLATWVRPHNLAGRAYLAAIMPFHISIARDALARVAAASATT